MLEFFRTLLEWFSKNKIQIIELFTMVSILIGVIAYIDSKIVTRKNNRILIKNTILEIQNNIKISTYFNSKKASIKKNKLILYEKLDCYFLKKSLTIISDSGLRNIIMNVIKDLVIQNSYFDLLNEYPKNGKEIVPETVDGFFEKSNQVITEFKKIEKELSNY